MSKINDLQRLMETLGAKKETGDGWASWTIFVPMFVLFRCRAGEALSKWTIPPATTIFASGGTNSNSEPNISRKPSRFGGWALPVTNA